MMPTIHITSRREWLRAAGRWSVLAGAAALLVRAAGRDGSPSAAGACRRCACAASCPRTAPPGTESSPRLRPSDCPLGNIEEESRRV